VRWFDSYTLALQRLELKRGMRVLCIRNHDGLVNGDLGTVTDIADHDSECGPAWVDIDMDRVGHVRDVPFRFELKRMVRGQEVTVYAVRQFPYIPAYGLTVHKAQGMTLDLVNIDGSRINFAAGQVYVAMSRCRTKAGLRVQNASQFAAFSRPAVERYYKSALAFH
jgi:ATP-dependent exoDNAse (exonuclease V) alpha subunit